MMIQVGSKLQRTGALGSIHNGVYVGPRAWSGEDVVHNNKNGGVELVRFRDFAAGQTVYVTPANARSGYEREQIASRALALLGQRYDLVNFNCEHLVSYAQTGVPVSPQLRLIAGLAVVFASLAVIAPHARA